MPPIDPVLVLFRRDLRLTDHPALHAAVASGAPVVPVFVWDDPTLRDGSGRSDSSGRPGVSDTSGDQDGPDWPVGAAQKWWIHHSLSSLRRDLREIGSDLVLRAGATSTQVAEVAAAVGARTLYRSRRYEPRAAAEDRSLIAQLEGIGISTHTFAGSLLHNPDEVRTGGGKPYRVFTPFFRKFLDTVVVGDVLPAPQAMVNPQTWPASVPLSDLRLLPEKDWADGFYETGEPGEAAALRQLEVFGDGGSTPCVADYDSTRDLVGEDGTSKLSPRLAIGELSPRHVWSVVASRDGDAFLRQLVWREFSYHVLVNNPTSDHAPLRSQFDSFPWVTDAGGMEAWKRGLTGYPIVDAGMRQLWQTGWMHNRARMIVASFLTKHLRVHWLHGARWFWDTLVDADLANNSMGWQWSAGSGADAQPFFRIFNPTLQGKKFDSEGTYVRRWVPELSGLPSRYIHEPSKAPGEVLRKAGVELGRTYPLPIVDHKQAREAALAAYQVIRKTT